MTFHKRLSWSTRLEQFRKDAAQNFGVGDQWALSLKKELYNVCLLLMVGRDSAIGLASLRAGRSGDRIPVGARFSAPFQTGPGTHANLLYNGFRVFPGGKEGGAWR